jgi:hypothetical protein
MTKALDAIEKLVISIANKAMENDVDLCNRVDALKVLTPYYNALRKSEPPVEVPSDDETMDDLQAQVREVANGGTVSARNGRRN